MNVVETARLYLRPLHTEDLDDYYRCIYADPEVMRTLPGQAPISREAFEIRARHNMIDHWLTHGFGPWVVIHKPEARLIGHCGLKYWPESPEVEVFFALDKHYWGRGLATEGAWASLQFGFERLRLQRIIAAAQVENVSSRRVLEKIGLHYEATREFHGLEVALYSLHRDQFRPPPLYGV